MLKQIDKRGEIFMKFKRIQNSILVIVAIMLILIILFTISKVKDYKKSSNFYARRFSMARK